MGIAIANRKNRCDVSALRPVGRGCVEEDIAAEKVSFSEERGEIDECGRW